MANGQGMSGIRQRLSRRGLALPALRLQGGYFASKSPHDTAWGNLLLTIFTPLGGRFMNRGFGSGLNTILFEPNLPDSASRAEFIIRDSASRHTPHIIITDVIVVNVKKTLQIKVSFHLVDDTRVEERLIQLDRAQIVRLLGLAA